MDAAARHISLACYPSQPHAHGAFPRHLARAAARAEARVASYVIMVPLSGLQVDTGFYLVHTRSVIPSGRFAEETVSDE